MQSELGHILSCPQVRPYRETAWYLSALPSSFLAWNTRALTAATESPIRRHVSWVDKSPSSRHSTALRIPGLRCLIAPDTIPASSFPNFVTSLSLPPPTLSRH